MFDTSGDLAFMIQELGEPVTSGASSAKGIIEHTDAIMETSQGPMQLRATTILMISSEWEGFGNPSAVEAEGFTWRVDRAAPEDDGEITRLYVARAP
jgi:hypothetical protein